MSFEVATQKDEKTGSLLNLITINEGCSIYNVLELKVAIAELMQKQQGAKQIQVLVDELTDFSMVQLLAFVKCKYNDVAIKTNFNEPTVRLLQKNGFHF